MSQNNPHPATKVLQRGRFIVPNLFTSLNFLVGVWAILLASSVLSNWAPDNTHIIYAANLIIYCVLFDKLDGFAARLMKASSEFGAQFDSLADLIAFGLAPAIVSIFAYKQFAPLWYSNHQIIVLAATSLYVLCAALRLARYNAIDSDAHPDFFVGMPTTMAGGAMALITIIFAEHNLFANDALVRIPVLAEFFFALLMVSPFLLPKVKPRKNKIINTMQLICIAAAYVLGLGMYLPEVLAAMVIIYFVIGFGYGRFHNEAPPIEE